MLQNTVILIRSQNLCSSFVSNPSKYRFLISEYGLLGRHDSSLHFCLYNICLMTSFSPWNGMSVSFFFLNSFCLLFHFNYYLTCETLRPRLNEYVIVCIARRAEQKLCIQKFFIKLQRKHYKKN